jgi:hypothetical protein
MFSQLNSLEHHVAIFNSRKKNLLLINFFPPLFDLIYRFSSNLIERSDENLLIFVYLNERDFFLFLKLDSSIEKRIQLLHRDSKCL